MRAQSQRLKGGVRRWERDTGVIIIIGMYYMHSEFVKSKLIKIIKKDYREERIDLFAFIE